MEITALPVLLRSKCSYLVSDDGPQSIFADPTDPSVTVLLLLKVNRIQCEVSSWRSAPRASHTSVWASVLFWLHRQHVPLTHQAAGSNLSAPIWFSIHMGSCSKWSPNQQKELSKITTLLLRQYQWYRCYSVNLFTEKCPCFVLNWVARGAQWAFVGVGRRWTKARE